MLVCMLVFYVCVNVSIYGLEPCVNSHDLLKLTIGSYDPCMLFNFGDMTLAEWP